MDDLPGNFPARHRNRAFELCEHCIAPYPCCMLAHRVLQWTFNFPPLLRSVPEVLCFTFSSLELRPVRAPYVSPFQLHPALLGLACALVCCEVCGLDRQVVA